MQKLTKQYGSASVKIGGGKSISLHLRRDIQANRLKDACADKYHDMGTNDFLIGLMEQHEKVAWIRAHVEGRQLKYW